MISIMAVENSFTTKYSVSSRIKEFKYQHFSWKTHCSQGPFSEHGLGKVPVSTHNAFGSVFAWLSAPGNSRERRLLVFDLFSFILLLPLAAMGTSLGLRVLAKDVVGTMTGVILVYTRFLQLAMITGAITLDAAILTWSLVRLQYHFLHWHNWYKRNCKVILIGYPDPQIGPAVQHISSATVREMQF